MGIPIQCIIIIFSMLAAGPITQMPQPKVMVNDTAQEIIKKLRAKYGSYESLEADFSLEIDYGNGESEKQSGVLIQKGKQFRMDATSQAIYCDGVDLWIHLKENQEVQINSYDEEDESLNFSPSAVLSQYDNGEYEYALMGEIKENGTILQEIEFKPIDNDSEFSKIRLSVDKKKQELKKLKVFSKDGTRLSLEILDVKINLPYSENIFTFDKSKNPKVHIEDLRID